MDFPLDAMDAGVRDCSMLPLMGSHTCGMNNQHESWVDLRLGEKFRMFIDDHKFDSPALRPFVVFMSRG
jgi:hypothetical protein